MSSVPAMHDANGRPVAWVAEWAGPHEGGMTLAMKYAWANALDGAAASKSICGKSLVQKYSQRTHGRSFLVPGWARVAMLDTASIGALIAQRDITHYAGRWGQWLASDAYFRYCPECIQHGYQSLLYQVDALSRCPVHRTKLLSACGRCSAPTPRYALTAEAMANPFCCPACGAAYGERFDPRGWKRANKHVSPAALALTPLLRFLRRADQSKIDWLHWDEWFGAWLGESELREKRIATFDALRRIVEHNMGEDLFELPARPLSVLSGRFIEAAPIRWLGAPEESKHRYQIYKAIRRQLIKRAPRNISRPALFSPQASEISVSNEMLRLSLKRSPFLQAVWLWRLRFEELHSVICFHPALPRSLTLRDNALNWPWQGTADDSSWAYYVLTGFHASAEIVWEWWRRALELATASTPDNDGARSMELHMEFANRLSPSRLPVPPRVAAVFERDTAGRGPCLLHVVGPEAGFDRLESCHVCRRSDTTAGTRRIPTP